MCICTQDPAFSKQINYVPHMMTVTAVGVVGFALVFAVNSAVRRTAMDVYHSINRGAAIEG
jgi:hypothetical protein